MRLSLIWTAANNFSQSGLAYFDRDSQPRREDLTTTTFPLLPVSSHDIPLYPALWGDSLIACAVRARFEGLTGGTGLGTRRDVIVREHSSVLEHAHQPYRR